MLLFLCGCHDKTAKAGATDEGPAEIAVSRELAIKLSGIWYRGPSKSIYDRVSRKFSWGQEDYDYYNCLYIDLLSNPPILGFAEMSHVVNTMTASRSENAVLMLLSLANGGPAGTLLAKFPVPGLNMISLYRQDKSNLIWHEELTGSYYKLDGPGVKK